MTLTTTARNATLEDLVPMLKDLHVAKLDAVVPATAVRSVNGVLQVKGLSVFDDETPIRPTEIMDGHIAERLSIPVKYVRRMRAERPDLYDANFNGWIHGSSPTSELFAPEARPDSRSFLLRSFMGEPGEEGIGRALLSDRFGVIDNLDVLFSALEGIRDSGVEAHCIRADMSESRMNLRFAAPGIAAMAPNLLRDYRPQVDGIGRDMLGRLAANYSAEHLGWDHSKGELPPVAFAGFDLGNSETGGGAFVVTPVFSLAACKNGLVLNMLAQRRVHLGSKLDEGVITWSDDTRRKAAELVKAQTRDSVAAFLTEDFLKEQLAIIDTKAEKPVDGDVVKTIELVAKKLAYTEEEQAGILDHFVHGGQMTAGGVLNAITSYAQTVPDPDATLALEGSALEALDLVAA